jgi:hypothetical protein
VFVIQFKETTGRHLNVVFLAYKNGTVLDITNRKSGEARRLFARVRDKLYACQVGSKWIIDGRTYNQIFDETRFRLISDIASQEYDCVQGE